MDDKRESRQAASRRGKLVPRSFASATRGDNLVELIAEAISTSVFPPGSRLDEVTLAARYGVSRTPVREALRQLETTGLIERRPFRGAVVSSPSPEHLADMFIAASEIEAACARLAALSMTGAERHGLRRAHDRMAEVSRSADDAYGEANAALHRLLYVGAHNATLAAYAGDLRRRLQPFRGAQFEIGDWAARSFAEHETIVRAVERGNGDEAAALMREHMRLLEAAVDDVG